METDHFKVSAELLQKNAMKASIRDLNAEFQRKGGKVIHRSSKKGSVFLLSHPDPKYLEEFRVRLFIELGLMEDKSVPGEPKKTPVAPRYGEKHKLRPGWNVRSQKEINMGIEDDRPPAEMAENEEKREGGGRKFEYRERRIPTRPAEDAPPEPPPGSKSFEERWDDLDTYMELIGSALDQGAVDDGEIIRHAYEREAAPAVIKNLKKMLWDNRCRGLRDLCPYKKKKFRFEELMKICSGKVEGHERIDSPMKVFVDRWERNMKEMYGPFVDKEVEVEGKVSSYKTIYRKGNEHIKMLIYDTMVREAASRLDPRPTRKLWIRMKLSEYDELAGEEKVRIDDTIRFRGKCVFDTHFYDYWVVDLKELKVVRKGEGDVITVLAP